MGDFVGYLYIIIGGEKYDNVSSALRLNQAWKISLIGVTEALLLLASLLLFYALTRPLRKLTKEIKLFESSGFKSTSLSSDLFESDDELNLLKSSFHKMEQRLSEQVEILNKQDDIRREFFILCLS